MATPLASRRIVIAGASSLLGAELKSLLEESRFAASDFRLVDEESVAGILTEAGGEPAVIQPVEEDSFSKAWIVFFAGSSEFTRRNLDLAKRSGVRIVDLSGEIAGHAHVQTWLPKLNELTDSALRTDEKLFAVPSAPAEIIARLSLALHSFKLASLAAVAFQPVSSSAGKSGIDELESQTGQLLTFQPLGKEVFDAQVAFTMLDRFGEASRQKLQQPLEILPLGTTINFANKFPVTGDSTSSRSRILRYDRNRLRCFGYPGRHSSDRKSLCINLRLPAANAVKLAEKLLE